MTLAACLRCSHEPATCLLSAGEIIAVNKELCLIGYVQEQQS